ncbi:MAG: type II toxin-antitoxin system VapC family toxin [Terriglobales bacterium]
MLSALWSGGEVASAMEEILGRLRAEDTLAVAGIVYAELLAHPKAAPGVIDDFLQRTGIEIDVVTDLPVWQLAGGTYGRYCQRRRCSGGGLAKRLLADFVIGAHAQLRADRLATLDQDRYRADFPELVLIP